MAQRSDTTRLRTLGAVALVLALSACGPSEREVGSFSNDLLGNEIKIEALPDPAIPSVICHVARFERSVLDRARQGNWFEDPSNSSVSCQRTGPIDLARVPMGRGGEEIFSDRQSLFFKRTAVRRIIDLENRSILYVAHSREIIEGSAKMSVSSVPLTAEEAAAAQAAAN
ncbi:MAG: CreA family protein [Hyphomonadaceae bacterium]|nr:CreA family protein [Hyphomonadaceae bacterium]